jgi:hypothetical protein
MIRGRGVVRGMDTTPLGLRVDCAASCNRAPQGSANPGLKYRTPLAFSIHQAQRACVVQPRVGTTLGIGRALPRQCPDNPNGVRPMSIQCCATPPLMDTKQSLGHLNDQDFANPSLKYETPEAFSIPQAQRACVVQPRVGTTLGIRRPLPSHRQSTPTGLRPMSWAPRHPRPL